MTAALEQHDWNGGLARRAHALGGGEITAILALAGATDVITFSGGFPDPATFPADVLSGIAGALIAQDAAVALQYSATEGLAGVRDYVRGRLAAAEGRAPGAGELMITSGGIDCMELLAKSYVDPGDIVVVESPTYLGGIMAFRGYEADVRGVPIDNDGMRVDVLADLLAGGLRPKILYTIPDYQNPTGLSMTGERRRELVALARRYGFLILEDVAYRELGFGQPPPPSLWSLAPDVVLQAGTFSKIFSPGFRMGWAAGPAQIISTLVVAKQNSDQCAGALGQRMLEEYGRAGHLDRQLVKSRALYARRAALLARALAAHMPAGTTWTTPAGGFYIWVTAPDGVDTVALSAAARARKVAYVPGRPFYPDGAGATQIRLAYSRVADDLIDEGARRIGEVLVTALEGK
ncbi:MAG TPA: PLP-dependent aminotransferase family protein [Streptosporangiaceae bacterium]|nr:PLP-dependent aminotransferase family protein [Streptosporangiaceae bacterium]